MYIDVKTVYILIKFVTLASDQQPFLVLIEDLVSFYLFLGEAQDLNFTCSRILLSTIIHTSNLFLIACFVVVNLSMTLIQFNRVEIIIVFNIIVKLFNLFLL